MITKGQSIIGFYIIGFENDSVGSIKKDIRFLSEFDFDLVQVCVLTPLHGTPLWNQIERNYSAIDLDYSKHDMKTLVWNHPKISADIIADLLQWFTVWKKEAETTTTETKTKDSKPDKKSKSGTKDKKKSA